VGQGAVVIRRRRQRRAAAALCLLLFTLVAPGIPARAMEFAVHGSEVWLSGHVVGDEYSELLAILSSNPIKTVVFTYSNGGNANAGYNVGELIRERGLATVIRGSCASSCSRMWLGGVTRMLEGPNSRVGLHGNYENGDLMPGAPARLRAWLPRFAPVDRQLMEQWIVLPHNTEMMYFYNDRAELCDHRACTPIPGRNARNAGLTTN
jgi:hypothetical protein